MPSTASGSATSQWTPYGYWGIGRMDQKDALRTAADLWRQAASQGHSEAQCALDHAPRSAEVLGAEPDECREHATTRLNQGGKEA